MILTTYSMWTCASKSWALRGISHSVSHLEDCLLPWEKLIWRATAFTTVLPSLPGACLPGLRTGFAWPLRLASGFLRLTCRCPWTSHAQQSAPKRWSWNCFMTRLVFLSFDFGTPPLLHYCITSFLIYCVTFDVFVFLDFDFSDLPPWRKLIWR